TGARPPQPHSPERKYSTMVRSILYCIKRITTRARALSGERRRVARALVQSACVVLLVVLMWFALAHALPAQAATSLEVTDCTALGLVNAMNFMNNNSITDGLITFNCNHLHAAATISITYP